MDKDLFLQQLRDLSLEEGHAYIQTHAAGLEDQAAFGNLLADEALDQLYTNPTVSLKDSDPRDKDMNPSGKRWKLRYPAAFAYALDDEHPGVPSVIPVGAVNGAGNAASYSNYPGSLGIATYGGEIPSFRESALEW
ncbi:MAG: hypothetical protein ACJ8CB_26380 [Ktedonobacteraceae bacterium]